MSLIDAEISSPIYVPSPANVRRAADRLTKHLNSFSHIPHVFDYAALDADLAVTARTAADKIRGLQKAALLDVGRELLAVKAALPHGRFDKWVQAEFGWSKSTALNFMHVAQAFGDEAKYVTVAYLPTAVLYDLASPSTPEAVRQAVVAVEPGKKLDPSHIKRAIREAKGRADATVRTTERKAAQAEPAKPRVYQETPPAAPHAPTYTADDSCRVILRQNWKRASDTVRQGFVEEYSDQIRALLPRFEPESAADGFLDRFEKQDLMLLIKQITSDFRWDLKVARQQLAEAQGQAVLS